MKKLKIEVKSDTLYLPHRTLRLEIDAQGFYIAINYSNGIGTAIKLDTEQIQQLREFLNEL